MKKIFILISHKLTDEQLISINNDLHIEEVVYMPDELKKIWSNIPPTAESIKSTIAPIHDWLSKNANKGDYAIIQGDMGVTYITINFAFSLDLIPCYTTTERITISEKDEKGTVNLIKKFKHVRFRLYEK